MIRFECDYAEGAHPKILAMLAQTNMEQTPGYGMDIYCEQATRQIKKLCECEKASVHFLVGGTQTNKTVIDAALRPHQGVICAQTGHINVHETGAIEATGHKVLPLESEDGTITANQIERMVLDHREDSSYEHMVQPAMVYISNPTENGTLYKRSQLEEISRVCRQLGLILFLDGARLGYGLMAHKNDITLPDLARLCDVFYIGGTKGGALFGEAVVITNDKINQDFRYLMKQNGGMLAKGRLLGIQFLTLLADNLYFDLAKHANEQAMRIRKAFEQKRIPFLYDSCTNQQFPILNQKQVQVLEKNYAFSKWSKTKDGRMVVRFCTSWATNPEDVDCLIKDIAGIPD